MILQYTNAFLLFDDDPLPEVGKAAIGGIAVGGKIGRATALMHALILSDERRKRNREERLGVLKKQLVMEQHAEKFRLQVERGIKQQQRRCVWATLLTEI